MKFDPEAWSFHQPRLGNLETSFIVPHKLPPKLLVVLCHGYGAPGTDLVNLFDDILHLLPDDSPPSAFLFPEGLIDMEEFGLPGGRAWWPLNMAQLMQLATTNRFDEMRNTVPPEIDSARSSLQLCVEEGLSFLAQETQSATKCPVILGGFSQGAMLAVDTLLRGSLPDVVGLIAYSGALICESQWRATERNVQGLPYIQSHGRFDQILPFETGTWLNGLFRDLGMQGSLLEFDGPHGIPQQALMQTAKLVHALSLSSHSDVRMN
jgi:phospholipase/carboxylesterase